MSARRLRRALDDALVDEQRDGATLRSRVDGKQLHGAARRGASGAAIPTRRKLREQKLLDLFEPFGARHRRQAVEEDPAVGARPQTLVAQHDDSEVARIAHQAADALLQRDDRLRDLLFEERTAAAPLDRVQPRLQHGIVRRCERQLVDDDDRQRRAFDVHAFPEAAGPEQHSVAVLAKLRQQRFARPVTLNEHRKRQRRTEPRATGSRPRRAARDDS